MIQIIVNGEIKELPHALKLDEVLDLLGLQADRIAVEVNRGIVRRAEWQGCEIKDQDRLEIVQFVGGG